MKKVVLTFLLLIVTGCGTQEIETVKNVEINYDKEYYTVYTPYKTGVGNNYVRGSNINSYDIENIESSLMSLSTEYFKVNNSYYQQGQYLTEETLKTLLDNEHFNNNQTIKIDGIAIDPVFVTTIHEQNYLTSNGTLKGISLGLVINPYQVYVNEYGSEQYKEIDENTLLGIASEKTSELIKYMRSNYLLKDVRILIAVYFQRHPNDIIPGKYEYCDITPDSDITLEKVEYEYQLLDSSYVSTSNISSYDAFANLKKELIDNLPNLYLTGFGLYNNKILTEVDITINGNSLNHNNILFISQLVSKKIVNDFNNVNIKVYIKMNNNIKAIIVKEPNKISCDVHILD